MPTPNWSHIDLSSPSERSLCLIDPLTFEDLLTEINSNLPEISASTVREQFETDLFSRMQDARAVFEDNLKNIVKHAQAERNSP